MASWWHSSVEIVYSTKVRRATLFVAMRCYAIDTDTNTHVLLKDVISNNNEWLSKIFNDMKHRMSSLRQLSFLSCLVVQCACRLLLYLCLFCTCFVTTATATTTTTRMMTTSASRHGLTILTRDPTRLSINCWPGDLVPALVWTVIYTV